ncbi:MAG TPA: hypothetical protein IGS53_04675 [Leptolyngbyaceae cyanobacterium M33_DOE_097]|uniref:Surface-adhesin protein E-like domain-containing protein n=1 Tax=Oscillatoriales cyanobacterium SpSt-418 TaxID=2282169 RepID=A0A7C3PFZ3_9CYAN|nr:hypothetical protein [Leptolyngbyaceae cyanobacterium M33_DOE_097]
MSSLLRVTAIGIASVVGTLAVPAIAQIPNTWVRINTDEYDNIAYVDRASIQGSTQFRYFWTYVTAGAPYPDEVSQKQVYATSAYVSTDCKTKRYRLRKIRYYDQQSKVIREDDLGESGPDGFATFHPAAIATVNYVCSRGLEQPKPQPKPATKKPAGAVKK